MGLIAAPALAVRRAARITHALFMALAGGITSTSLVLLVGREDARSWTTGRVGLRCNRQFRFEVRTCSCPLTRASFLDGGQRPSLV